MLSLALGYLPFVIGILLGLAVAYDARIRLRRPAGPTWIQRTQLVLGLLIALLAVASLVISPRVGLVDLSPLTPERVFLLLLAVTVLAIPTLLVGLARPATPHPRRGFTALTLSVDALIVALCAFALWLAV